ncbi:MAG: argininosuccinate lyase [Clostridia bacterium]|nr:argininosuccinate lyase [Clostridia bacterium]MBR4053371.1 argininosuccinate lyase [Clostridia bacterium]
MEKMWAGRTAGQTSALADDFNSSIHVDSRMYKEDIKGSMAHAAMLAEVGILTAAEADEIIAALEQILGDIGTGELPIDMNAEDIHMFVESVLTKRIGDLGKKLHTARSRNDQVAVDMRLYMRGKCGQIQELLLDLIHAIVTVAEEHKYDIMPGYTHLQRAQPIVFAHHLLAYAEMFRRDLSRVEDAVKRMNVSPLGACALAGTTYPISRTMTAKALGFDDYARNSIDAVSDRDFCVELLSAFSVIMMHLSRFSEEVILWSSWEFSYVELDDAYTTGSSIMPQKKNSDMAELVRGKTGRVYGDLMGTLTMLKGLPLAYNKDMQEDKESLFDATETVARCLEIFAPMIRTMRVKSEHMYRAAQRGFINATDLADYLTKRGMPFRTAYKTVGSIVSDCIAKGTVLEDLPLEAYKSYSTLFEEDLFEEISLKTCVAKRISEGATGYASVEKQLTDFNEFLKTKGI